MKCVQFGKLTYSQLPPSPFFQGWAGHNQVFSIQVMSNVPWESWSHSWWTINIVLVLHVVVKFILKRLASGYWRFNVNMLYITLGMFERAHIVSILILLCVVSYTVANSASNFPYIHKTHLGFFVLLGVSNVSLLCKSRNLIESVLHPTAYCTISGKLIVYFTFLSTCNMNLVYHINKLKVKIFSTNETDSNIFVA